MITFLFEVNPVSFDQKQFSNFAQQRDMNEMRIVDFMDVLCCETEFSCILNFSKWIDSASSWLKYQNAKFSYKVKQGMISILKYYSLRYLEEYIKFNVIAIGWHPKTVKLFGV